MTSPMPLDQAQVHLLSLVVPLAAEEVAVADALGRHLAAPLLARRTQPPADLSAMDGYAFAGDGPWEIVGESRCGYPYSGTVHPGEAVRISTGALMPRGADTVLLQENAERNGQRLHATEAPIAGRHIRREGFDFRAGDLLIGAGEPLGPAGLALALAGGHGTVAVRGMPSVAIIETGDELSDPRDCADHQIPASNGAMIAALCREIPSSIINIGPVPDSAQELLSTLQTAEDCDVIVTVGGASVGDHDLIRPALEDWGAEPAFWKVAIKPGKPLLVARRGRQIVLGLPGNPVSSYVTAVLFLLPLLRALSGAMEPLPRRVMLPLALDLRPAGPRREFLRAIWDGEQVIPLFEQDSSALLTLARANALIERTEDMQGTKAGTDVPVILLRNG